ncbi:MULTISPECIES: hypothetical protein [unclassified Paludibacterium]|uniref:hypothetical protein n=1 Tax=unclassified Paludibacterium TaxID=2618429 RepID=UPI001C04F419|nr:hypothetical protein [Paludibacterium sp. B53371]BEV71491.1 hypothetical protein THUN1379_09730 [Paludibacterium sp. THUN1379]
MFGNLIRRVFGSSASASAEELATIERMVAATDARLALLPGYRKALLPGVRVCRDYAAELVRDLPDPLELSLLSFTLDRRLGLFFSSPASLLGMLMRSDALQAFFASPSQGDQALALLLMQRRDSQRYGMATLNGEVRSDVAQTVVSFDHHRMVLPCPSVEVLRASTAERALEVIAGLVAQRLALLAKERSDLESELTRIRLRLTALSHPESLLIDALPDDDPLPRDRAGLLQRQEAAQCRLNEVRSVTTLNGLLELVAHMLSHPQDYFRLQQASLTLDRMGVVRSADEIEEGTRVCMEELLLSPEEPVRRVIVPVSVSRTAMQELARSLQADA